MFLLREFGLNHYGSPEMISVFLPQCLPYEIVSKATRMNIPAYFRKIIRCSDIPFALISPPPRMGGANPKLSARF